MSRVSFFLVAACDSDSIEVPTPLCDDEPCLNGGECFGDTETYTCVCPEGTLGDNCETNPDDCTNDPCWFAATCADGVGEYTCNCATGYSGQNCEINDNANVIPFTLKNQTDSMITVTIFQKNVAGAFDETATAWRVISLAAGGEQLFTLTSWLTGEVSVPWSSIEGSPAPLQSGTHYESFGSPTAALLLREDGTSGSVNEFELENSSDAFVIDAEIFRDGKLLAQAQLGLEEEKAFGFNPTIWIGVTTDVIEGQVLDSEQLSEFNTELNFFMIVSSDIIVEEPMPGLYSFHLDNVIYP